MSYNTANKLRRNQYIMQVYRAAKHHDVPDTRIVRHTFPKHGIFISYRTFKTIKNEALGTKPQSIQQQLF